MSSLALSGVVGLPNWIFVPVAATFVVSALLLGAMFIALRLTKAASKKT
ncbi:MAG: hypothetical protein WAO61_02490 [Solirubrobacterales bacterium]